MTATVRIERGTLYLDRDTCERFFTGLQTVILVRREQDLCILPVRHAAAGGYLLKLRNIAGDRVVHAPDFLRECGIDDGVTLDLEVAWSSELGGLVAAKALQL